MGSSNTPMRGLFSIILLFLLHAPLSLAQEPECSASNPCALGCCSKYGFCGLGPKYCSPKICVANCDRKSECDPDNWGKEYSKSEKCPLNVCCSKYGFCGTTKGFCGDKKVNRPGPCKNKGVSRVVGYYEGWARNRPCNSFMPEQIPAGVYTHLNYAFATINPKTFEVRAATEQDDIMQKRLVDIKKLDHDVKVFIAIGGWAFNDPGPTATTFSDIARSAENTEKFIKSLIPFLAHYGFDGLDLDWEYPEAPDRSGRPEDFKNFPKFIEKLKASLMVYGKELSITLPASYWYLQHFDIVKLEKHVDFFNMMTYDLHGTWDLDSEFVSPVLDAHTNLTEIKLALDLLWRNNINPDKVVLGLAFYGRAFVPSDPGCTRPGCLFASGAPRLPCSGEVSVALNSEIVDILHDNPKLDPKLDKDAAVNQLVYGNGNNWVSFDDGKTFKLKADFAKSECLGGVMVWAVSHDTKDGKFSLALADAIGKVPALPIEDDGKVIVRTKHDQCKWTGCGQPCPSGWLAVQRTGPGGPAPGDPWEYMLDEQGCDGLDGVHTFCCPPGVLHPNCGWYTHNNGACQSGCPTGYTEVGGNNMYCSNSDYQSACCATDRGLSNMILYSKCNWGDYPECAASSCPSGRHEILGSMNGPGASACNFGAGGSYEAGNIVTENRKYCCDTSDKNERWGTCEWYNQGLRPADNPDYCSSECPDNMVRVSMEYYGKCRGGARAQCCLPDSVTITKRDSEEVRIYKNYIDEFLKDPTCSATVLEELIDGDSMIRHKRRSLEAEGQGLLTHGEKQPVASRGLNARYSTPRETDNMGGFISLALGYRLYQSSGGPAYIVELWNDRILVRFNSLSYADLGDYLLRSQEGEWMLQAWGTSDLGNYIACNLPIFNDRVAYWKGKNVVPMTCVCYSNACCETIPEDPKDACVINNNNNNKLRRLEGMLGVSGPESLHLLEQHERNLNLTSREEGGGHALNERAGSPGDWSEAAPNGIVHSGNYKYAPWPTPAELARVSTTSWIWQNVFAMDLIDDCTLLSMSRYTYNDIVQYCHQNNRLVRRDALDFVQVEHYVEKNAAGAFTKACIRQSLESGVHFAQGAALPPAFFTTFMATSFPALTSWRTTPGAQNIIQPRSRLMHAWGSKKFQDNFMLLKYDLNNFKEGILKGDDAVDKNKMGASIAVPRTFLTKLRQVFGVINYLNDADALDRGEDTLRRIRWEFYVYQEIYREWTISPSNPGGDAIDAVVAWDRWFLDYMDTRIKKARDFLLEWCNEGLEHFEGMTDNLSQTVVSILHLYLDRAHAIEGYNDLGYPTGTPTPP